jgi:hypothetical protein
MRGFLESDEKNLGPEATFRPTRGEGTCLTADAEALASGSADASAMRSRRCLFSYL